MCGEELQHAFAGYPGIYGDRLYAFRSSAAPAGFPYLTGREQERMLQFRPRFRYPAQMGEPVNLAEAEALGSGVTPVYTDSAATIVDVKTPEGESLPVDDPRLIEKLREGIRERHELSLLRSDRAMTDCRPISLFSLQTVRQLSDELGIELDKRRFRANVYLDLDGAAGFAEEEFVGRSLRIGAMTVVAVLQRDARCKMITLDPDTSEADPEVMRHLARAHEGKAGVYGAVLREGNIRPGDTVSVLD